MELLYDADGVRELDRIAIQEKGIPGLILMKRAAQSCVDVLLAEWCQAKSIAVLCGSGNNAADGFIIAGLLASRGLHVKASLVGRRPVPTSDAGSAFAYLEENDVALTSVEEALQDVDVIVDALLGTGIKGPVRDAYVEAIDLVSASGAGVLAVDLPSGLCADTGNSLGVCLRATHTVTFIGRKLGLFTADGPEYSGKVHFADLHVPPEVLERVQPVSEKLAYEQLKSLLKPRHRNAHKRNHGHLLIVGGDLGMPGAVVMSAQAALYAGAGLVSVATRAANTAAVVSSRPEAMVRGVEHPDELQPLIEKASAIVLGPGLGMSDWGHWVFDLVISFDGPMVVDADGLNLLAKTACRADTRVLTPHPGEAGRLLNGASIQDRRRSAAIELQEKYGGTVLLKGAGTLIADIRSVSLCPYGNPGMSVAGMGDVLAGTIGGLLAQGLSTENAARLGAVVHSLAADQLAEIQGERGMLATELLAPIRALLNP